MSMKYPLRQWVPSPVQSFRSATYENEGNNKLVFCFLENTPMKTSVFRETYQLMKRKYSASSFLDSILSIEIAKETLNTETKKLKVEPD